jgi:hypothetical protein
MSVTLSLLPLTPDTMRDFHQEIVVDIPALTKKALHAKIAARLPKMVKEGASFSEAFEALRQFRTITREEAHTYTDAERTQLAELEVEWCMDLLGRLPTDGGAE